MSRFGAVYEDSPELAEAAWAAGGATAQSAGELATVFERVLLDSGQETQLRLLRAHPELAVAEASGLTAESRSEQRGAGLDRCSAQEFEAFRSLNRTYRQRFGFPFIVAVRGMDRHAILRQFRERVDNGPREEFETALRQVMRIARYRIEEAWTGE